MRSFSKSRTTSQRCYISRIQRCVTWVLSSAETASLISPRLKRLNIDWMDFLFRHSEAESNSTDRSLAAVNQLKSPGYDFGTEVGWCLIFNQNMTRWAISAWALTSDSTASQNTSRLPENIINAEISFLAKRLHKAAECEGCFYEIKPASGESRDQNHNSTNEGEKSKVRENQTSRKKNVF